MKSGNSLWISMVGWPWPSPIHKDLVLDPGTLGHIWPVTTPWGFTPLRPHPWGRGYGWLVELHLPVPSCWFGKGRGWKVFFVGFAGWFWKLMERSSFGSCCWGWLFQEILNQSWFWEDSISGHHYFTGLSPFKAMWSPCQDDHREEMGIPLNAAPAPRALRL